MSYEEALRSIISFSITFTVVLTINPLKNRQYY
ncbi:hypothetical protein [Campylobacter phage CJLB-7]|nr:hypothetical protein [Campylobacter phage CJLB-7]